MRKFFSHEDKMKAPPPTWWHHILIISRIQLYLRETMGLVPNHCNKVSITVRWVKWIFWFRSMYNSYVYTIRVVDSVCNDILSKKSMYLYSKILYLLKSWPSPDLSVVTPLPGRLLPWCWRLRTIRLWQLLKVRQQWGLPHPSALPFMSNVSAACDAVW